MSVESISLAFKDADSDKVYHVQIEEVPGGFQVNFQYGKRGTALQAGTKTPEPVTLEQARKTYEKIVKEKTGKGYTTAEAGTPFAGTDKAGLVSGLIPQLLNPVDEARALELIEDDEWFAQEKMDGRHQMVRCTPATVTISNRKGLVVAIPAVIEQGIRMLLPAGGVLDGEAIGDFYHVFDILEFGKDNLRNESAHTRSQLLQDLLASGSFPGIKPVRTAFTREGKQALYDAVRKQHGEGVVFKKKSATYTPGRPNSGGDMLKFKFKASATCSVIMQHDSKRSVGLALLQDNGELQFVGNVTIPVNHRIPACGNFVEVEYLYAYPGGSLFQPVYKGPREDKCKADLYSSLKFKQGTTEDEVES